MVLRRAAAGNDRLVKSYGKVSPAAALSAYWYVYIDIVRCTRGLVVFFRSV